MNEIEITKSQRDQEYFKNNGVYPISDDSISDEDRIEISEEDFENMKATQYQRDRRYPSAGEQSDMQYWDAINGTTIWLDTITAIKAKYPKGE